MSRFVPLFSALSMLYPLSLYAEGEGEEVVYEEVIEEEAIDPSEGAAFESSSSDNTSSVNSNDITALRAQVASLSNKVHQLEGQLKHTQQNVSAPGGVIPIHTPTTTTADVITDPDVRALMKEMGATNEQQLEKSLDAHSQSEAVAMVHARKSAGNLPVGPGQSAFDKLHKLYGEAMAANATDLPSKATAFNTACNQYISAHQTDPSSRSALYYLGRVLLKQNQMKEAQNAFARVYRGDEQGPHAADALIGMAEILIVHGNKPAAIKFLEKIKKDFKSDYLTKETKDAFKAIALKADSKLSFETPVKTAPVKTVSAGHEISKKPEAVAPKGKSA